MFDSFQRSLPDNEKSFSNHILDVSSVSVIIPVKNTYSFLIFAALSKTEKVKLGKSKFSFKFRTSFFLLQHKTLQFI